MRRFPSDPPLSRAVNGATLPSKDSGPIPERIEGTSVLQPTDINNPEYFHKVVDCQWACPAHTPVPEYIRLIADQRYADAYMVNWHSNVFPGILGRTCDRPCEPACRRGRVEEEPVAICRLKRVAADFKGDVHALMPLPAPIRNGHRIACIGAGPAAMTVARSAFGEHRQFNGRLMNRLREARGLNYGDYAYLEHFEQEGGDSATAQLGRARHQQDFSIWLRPVQNENRLFALRAALSELGRSLAEEPFTQAEVDQTKGFLDGYLLLFDQTDARRLGYALDDAFADQQAFLSQWRASLRNVTAEQVNAVWRKWIDPHKLAIVIVGPGMAELKKTILDGSATSMHYQKDAQGNTSEKAPALLAADKLIEKLPLGAKGDPDVEIVPVEQLFQ